MHDYKYDIIVFVGRFQPFHLGHSLTVDKALENARHVIVGVGSSNKPRDIRNPFTFEERKHTIEDCFPELETNRLVVFGLEDETYNDDLWADKLRTFVNGFENIFSNIGTIPEKARIGIIGNKRDHTSFYFDLFPEWEHVDGVKAIEDINATKIRSDFFSLGQIDTVWLPEPSQRLLKNLDTETYQYLMAEYDYVESYKKSWTSEGTMKYGGPIHHTADAVVLCKGHVLLVKRRAHPGKGLFAFPGGYVNHKEKIIESVIRELKEETRIDVPRGKLIGSIIENKTFDDPERSVRGRVITNAFFIQLTDEKGLPKVKGGDDAASAQWVPLNEFYAMRDEMFEDHYHIGKYFFRGR